MLRPEEEDEVAAAAAAGVVVVVVVVVVVAVIALMIKAEGEMERLVTAEDRRTVEGLQQQLVAVAEHDLCS